MFKRRDVPSVLLLSMLIILVILTLSQILVVHNGHLGTNRHNMRKLQVELRELDINLHSVMMHRVPSIELNRRLLQNQINSNKFLHILKEASKTRTFSGINRTSLTESDRHLNKGDFEANESSDTNNLTFPSEHRQNPSLMNKISSDKWGYRSISGTQTHKRFPEKAKGSMLEMDSSFNTHIKSQGDTLIYKKTVSSKKTHPVKLPGKDTIKSKNVTGFNQNLINSGNSHLNHIKQSTQYCPSVPPNLKGHMETDLHNVLNKTYQEILHHCKNVQQGGRWRPSGCIARHKVAIVIPYRDREHHLLTLLFHLHPLLQSQQLDYRVFVVEQKGNDTFNKARLMNIAFVEASKVYPFQCAVFHDVDLVPEDDRNMYSCPTQPRHTSVAIDEMGYKLIYHELVGGVLNMRREHFQMVNGYSNLYWGWGAEDDDMAYRIMQVGLQISRPPENIARYKTIPHTKRKPSDWRKRAKLLVTGPKRYQFDGLNSLTYKVVHIEEKALFTHILVDIGKPPKGFR